MQGALQSARLQVQGGRPKAFGSPLSLPRLSEGPARSRRCAARASRDQQQRTKDDAPIDAEWAQELAKELVEPSELGQRGEAWFAAQVAALLLVAFPPGALRPLVDAAGWAVVAAGLGIAAAGVGVLGQRLTPLPKPREGISLATGGIYSYCRHPMYGGLVLVAAGLGVGLGDELRLAFAALTFFILDRKASFEEELLEERFGDEYAEYKRRTKKLLPYIY